MKRMQRQGKYMHCAEESREHLERKLWRLLNTSKDAKKKKKNHHIKLKHTYYFTK